MEHLETRFAWNGAVSLAYQVCGDGPGDLVYLQGYCSNVDMNWESPYLSRFLRCLAAHARLIVTDRRGWGGAPSASPPGTCRTSTRSPGPCSTIRLLCGMRRCEPGHHSAGALRDRL